VFKAVDVEKEVPRGMLTQEDDVEIHALAARGWNKSAIARHTGRDRKTIAKYLKAGGPQRLERTPSCLEPFREYITARFVDDPHLPAVTLLDELTAAGLDRSHPTLGCQPMAIAIQLDRAAIMRQVASELRLHLETRRVASGISIHRASRASRVAWAVRQRACARAA